MSDPTTPETITLKLPSRLELLAVLDRVAFTVCERMEFDEDTTSQVSMSVIEAGTNAVQHGHKRDAAKFFETEFRLYPDRHLLDMRGRGIFIMRSCCDEVFFDFTDKGTVCHLVKYRAAARRAADA